LYAQGAATYSWNTGATADSIGVQPVVATSYTAYGTDLNGCTSSKGFTVTVLPKPTVSIIGGSTLCSGKTLALTGSGAISYTWTTGIVALGINVIANSDTTIRVTGANQQGCSNTASIHITVNPSPTLSVLSTTACAGQAATLIAEPVASQADALSYLWVPGSASGATYNPVAPFTTNYTVTATLGPCFTRAAATVSVLPSTFPQVAFSYSSPLCGGSAPALPMLSTNFTSGGTFYSTSGINVDPASGLIDLSNAPEGMANVQYSVAPKGCRLQGFTSAFVQIIKQTKINIDPTYYGIAPGESVKLTNSGGASSYEWSPAQGLSCTFCQVPTATPAKTQVYCLGSSEACVVGGCVMVEVICDRTGDFSVPTAFTPNKDGINDKYCLKGWGECNTGFNIKIFDRWGEMVFESNDPNFCWDGEFNGNLLPTATYVYFINADFERVPGYRQSGNISLIR
jgi:gliding motility-associated-like protein